MKAFRWLRILLVFILLLTLTSTAFADGDASITLHYAPGVCPFRFYRVAELTGGSPAPTAPFDRYVDSVTLLSRIGELNPDEVRLLSTTLEGVILRDEITPTYVAATDGAGALTLPVPDEGIYLILGESTRDEQYVYTPAPVLVSVPTFGEDGTLQKQVVLEHTKLEQSELKPEKVTYRVRKIWQDSGYESLRPVTVAVQLLQDGAVYDTVTLSRDNDWTYRWTDLPAGHVWTAVEEAIPDGYSLSVEKKQNGAVLTNRYRTPPPPPGGELPPTGQLWWPVPILLVAGVVLLILGCAPEKSRGK